MLEMDAQGVRRSEEIVPHGSVLVDGVSSGDVADLVLENNRFGLLPDTLAEGRNILRNLRRAGKIFLLKNVYTLLLITATLGVFRLPFPYLPQQVTLLNKLTISIPVLVITVSRTSAARAGHAEKRRSQLVRIQ